MTSLSRETDRIRDVYDQLAPDWDRREGRGERLLMGDRMRQTLASYLRGDVLELGTGTGATFAHISWGDDGVTSFTATDLSAGMLDEARRHDAIDGKPVTFRQVEASDLPFPDARFDTVTTSLTLCTVPDPEQTLREMSRVARPDGRIVMLEHVRAPNRILAGAQRLLTPMQERRMGCHLDRPTDRLVQDIGFTIEHRETRLFSIIQMLVLRPLSPERDDARAQASFRRP